MENEIETTIRAREGKTGIVVEDGFGIAIDMHSLLPAWAAGNLISGSG